jgi:alpha-glucuronidase
MAGASLWAETGADAWLRYAPLEPAARVTYAGLPAVVVVTGDSAIMQAAAQELVRGVRGMLGRTLRIEAREPEEDTIVLRVDPAMTAESYFVRAGPHLVSISGGDERGVLYGVFAFLRRMALHREITELGGPHSPVRWTNEWNNLDGSVERGYAGRSIFFDNGHVVADLTRAGEYARLLASIGINGCVVSNVNANPRMLTSEFIPELARLNAAFRPWGVRMAISVDFGSPKEIGGLDSFDPLDPRVIAWWKAKVDEVYAAIPDLGGFVLKADSEGRAGPSVYGRTHADAANLIARALKPHGGLLFYRGFVYDHHMDWRNSKNDRARAAYDNFHALDGKFDDNVLVQIKYGPIDFQVREPVSPLFGALHQTNEAIELQVTQEYTGQQRHLCYLAPMWKEVLDFDLRAAGDRPTPVKALVRGFVGVSNVGLDANWLGHDLALANLYSFGRLAWNPDLSAREMVDEWTRLTFGHDARVVDTIVAMELESWPAYEAYTGFLGVGGLTDIIGVHFGPGIESSERNGWGQWHRADEHGIGMDRTVATGTGFIAQYSPPLAHEYESLADCPDKLLLFLHHVAYTHVLHSGKTVIQHIYDSHYDGAAVAQTFPERWKQLRGRMDEQRYQAVLGRLEYQAGHAIVWRDAICDWFLKTSGIPDTQGRAGNHPDRVEAESMTLDGYVGEAVIPWETASGGMAIGCPQQACAATMAWKGATGRYRIIVQYFDERDGVSSYRLLVSGHAINQWVANNDLPSDKPNGHTSTRRVVSGVALRAGDEIRIEATTGGKDRADIDYVEITRTED